MRCPNVAGLDGQGVANVECTCNHCKHEDGDGDGHEIMVILIIMVAMIIIKFAIITMILFPIHSIFDFVMHIIRGKFPI